MVLSNKKKPSRPLGDAPPHADPRIIFAKKDIDPVTGGTYHKIMHVATTTTNAYNRKRCYGAAAVEEA